MTVGAFETMALKEQEHTARAPNEDAECQEKEEEGVEVGPRRSLIFGLLSELGPRRASEVQKEDQ